MSFYVADDFGLEIIVAAGDHVPVLRDDRSVERPVAGHRQNRFDRMERGDQAAAIDEVNVVGEMDADVLLLLHGRFVENALQVRRHAIIVLRDPEGSQTRL